MSSRFSFLTLLILAIGLAWPTLHALHLQPQTVFSAEWWSAWCLIVALTTTLFSRKWNRQVQWGLPVWAACIFVLASLMWSATGSNVGYVLYGALFITACLVGSLVYTNGGTLWIAAGLLLAAVLQSVAGGFQLADLDLHGMVLRKVYLQAFGNVGQANHYADLIYLGLASLGLLWSRGFAQKSNYSDAQSGVFGNATAQRSWIWDVAFVVTAIVLAVSAGLSASRGVWLYIGGFLVLGGAAVLRGDEGGKRLGYALLILAAVSIAAQLFVSYSGIISHLGVVSSIDRAGDAGSNGQRLYNWHAAWLAIKAHPLLGQGPGTFYKASIDAMFVTAPASYPKFAEHAHNFPLNLAAELGTPVAAFITVTLAVWFLRCLVIRPLSGLRTWALACVAVVGLHSMVEYPLWYAYFIVPVGLCMGVADAETADRVGRKRESLSVIAIGLLCFVGFAALTWVMHDWGAVRQAYETLNAEEPDTTRATRQKALEELDTVSQYSPFSLVAEGLRLQAWRPQDGGAARIAARCDRTWQYKPGWYLMMRCGEAYAISGRRAALERLVRAGCDGFPKHHQPLSEWASEFDATGAGTLKIAGRACLGGTALALADEQSIRDTRRRYTARFP